jgi:hypothetical protein
MPFAEGSRGCHVLFILDVQALNGKERHFILPLVIANFIMQSIAFISLPSLYIAEIVQSLFYLTIKDHTYLEAIFIALCTDDNLLEGSYSIHR